MRERSLLAALDYDFPMLGALMAQRAWTTVHLVWAESRTLFHARDPFPPGGVIEDPATGAAAAAFGGYLLVPPEESELTGVLLCGFAVGWHAGPRVPASGLSAQVCPCR